MAFWVGIAVTVASVVISFIWTQKTFPIRLALLVLGLAGVSLAADRYFEDQNRQKETLDYWEIARLNAFALHFMGGDLQDNTELNNIIGSYIHLNQNNKVTWDCNSTSIAAYTKAVDFDPKFPFSYFYRASCNRLNNADGWQKDADTARKILRITTQIPGHNQHHDQILRMLDRGDLGHPD
jgi:hypothetical protein